VDILQYSSRLSFLHSLLVAVTLGTLLTILVTRFLYAPIISTIFGVDGTDLDSVCRITPWIVASSFIGVMSHLILDFPMRWYNPILWPWINPYDIVGPLVLLFMPTFSYLECLYYCQCLNQYLDDSSLDTDFSKVAFQGKSVVQALG